MTHTRACIRARDALSLRPMFTIVYVAAAIGIPLFTLGFCLLGERIGH